MLENNEISRFYLNDFDEALLVVKLSNGKIETNLKLKGRRYDLGDSSMVPRVISYKELCLDPKKLLEFLFTRYLNNNMIVGTRYFDKIPYQKDKICFTMTGTDSSFSLAIDKNILSILPTDFIERLENAKRDGILKWIEEVETNVFSIDNFDYNDNNLYKSGIIGVFGEYYIYQTLKIKDDDNKVVIYEEEYDFVREIIKTLLNKGQESLLNIEDGEQWYSYDSEYKLNDKVLLKIHRKSSIEIFDIFGEAVAENNISKKKER